MGLVNSWLVSATLCTSAYISPTSMSVSMSVFIPTLTGLDKSRFTVVHVENNTTTKK